jgi:hypothetical protein
VDDPKLNTLQPRAYAAKNRTTTTVRTARDVHVTGEAAANELAPWSAGHIRASSNTKRVVMGQTVSAM